VLAVSTTGWWVIGFVLAGAVVVIAAALLLAIIALARRIVRQAHDIEAALDGARRNTEPLFDLAKTNLALERITRSLASLREGGEEERAAESEQSERGLLGRLADRISPGGSEA
jgi:hypothetical protein